MGAAGAVVVVVVVGLGGEFGRVCAQNPRTERGGLHTRSAYRALISVSGLGFKGYGLGVRV